MILDILVEYAIDILSSTPCRVPRECTLPREVHMKECRGDLSVYSNSKSMVRAPAGWNRHQHNSVAPHNIRDEGDPSYVLHAVADTAI